MSSLTEQVGILSKGFDDCLELILSDPQQKEVEKKGLDSILTTLKSSFLDLESELRDIRLNALENKQLSVQEANRLLKRDIEIKKEAVSKYVEKLNKWSKELPELEEKSRQASSIRTDGNDFDSSQTVVKQTEDKMEEEEEEDEFEEV